jgi:hypothetical protein
MLKRIVTFAFDAGNMVITSSIAALLLVFTTLKGMLPDIDDLFDQYANIIKGYAEQKRLARITLAGSTYAIVKAVRAYAIANGNWTLALQMTTSLSKLKRTGYATLLQNVNNWINVVGPLMTSLGDYGVTAADYTQWKADRDALTDLLTTPQEAIDAHTVLGGQIQTSMNDAMTLTHQQIDAIVAGLINSQPLYYIGYGQSRKITGPEERHTALKATVVNELNQPMWGITVTIDEYTHTDEQTGTTKIYKSTSAMTDINGEATPKQFFAALRTVTVSGPGIVSKTFGPFPFVHGKAITQTFTVQPSFDNLPAPSPDTTAPETSKVTVK